VTNKFGAYVAEDTEIIACILLFPNNFDLCY